MALKFVQTGTVGGSGSGSGTYDHNLLVNRGLPDQHTIESVTGLRTALDKKYEKPFSGIPKTDLAFDVATLHDLNIFRNTELADVINDLSAVALEVENARGGLDNLKAYIDTKVPYAEWTGTGTGGSGGGSHVDSQVGYPIYEYYRATEGQTLFLLTKTYQMGTHQLEVYLDGLKMIENDDYKELDDHSVEFLFPLEADSLVLFMVRAVINSGLHEEYVASTGQTLFTLVSPYGIHQNILQVYRNGVLQHKGRDYREMDDHNIEFMYPLNSYDFITFHQAGATDPIAGTLLESEIGKIKINHGYTTMTLQEIGNIPVTDYTDTYIDTFITDASLDRVNSYPFLFENGSVQVGDANFVLDTQAGFEDGTVYDVDIATYPNEILLKNLPGGTEIHSFESRVLRTDSKVLHEALSFVNNHHEEFFFYAEEIPAGQTFLRVIINEQTLDLNTTDGYFFSIAADQDSQGNIHVAYHEQGSVSGVARVHYLRLNRESLTAEHHLIVSDTNSDAIRPDIAIDSNDVAHVAFTSKRVSSFFNVDYRTIDDGVLSGFKDLTVFTTSDALNPRIAVGTDNKAHVVFETITLDGATKNIRYLLLENGVVSTSLWATNSTTYDNVQADIDLDSFNDAHIVWRSKRLSTMYGVDYCSISSAGMKSGVRTVASTVACDNPKLAVDVEGFSHILFNANFIRSDHENICYAYVYPDGTVSPFVDVASELGIQFTQPDVQLYGNTIVASFLGDTSGYQIRKSLSNYTGMGRYDYIFDSHARDSEWLEILHTTDTPAGTTVSIEYRVSNDKVVWSAWEPIGTLLMLPARGQYLHARVTLTSSNSVATPIVHRLEARYHPSYIEVQSVIKTATKEPDAAIVIARFDGDVTFKVSRDGGQMFVETEIDKVASLVTTPSSKDMVIRAKIVDGSQLHAWGLLW